VSQLNQAGSQFRGTANLPSLDDPRALQQLSQAVDKIKDFEFQLNKKLAGDAQGGIRVGRTGDVPPAYKAWVNEYWRRIGKTPPAGKDTMPQPKPLKPPK
jgi:hypothetical protein